MHRSDNLLPLNKFNTINKKQLEYIISVFSQALRQLQCSLRGLAS